MKVTKNKDKGTDLDDIISIDTSAIRFIPKTEKLDNKKILTDIYTEGLNKHGTQRGDIHGISVHWRVPRLSDDLRMGEDWLAGD